MPTKIQNLIIHDVDRDGWGSAALLVAELGYERCRLYPTVQKDGLMLMDWVEPRSGEHVWLLDIPTPKRWNDPPRRLGVEITWVDHHRVPATDSPPGHIRLLGPTSSKPTTTMHLLVEHGLVPSLHKPMEFVRTLCVPNFETAWTRIIDGMSAVWPEIPVDIDDLPSLLAGAPLGEPPSTVLEPLEDQATEQVQKRESTF
jgi:hypothetical protein